MFVVCLHNPLSLLLHSTLIFKYKADIPSLLGAAGFGDPVIPPGLQPAPPVHASIPPLGSVPLPGPLVPVPSPLLNWSHFKRTSFVKKILRLIMQNK